METRKNPYGDSLIEIELGLLEHNVRVDEIGALPYSYDLDVFMASLTIFMNAMIIKSWEYMDEKVVGYEDREKMSLELGDTIKNLVKKFTGIAIIELYLKI